jgi:hypothetical protein
MKQEFLNGNISAQRVKASGDGGFGNTAGIATLSGQEWYTQQAHRAVNQAIGRVIRNKDDYGAILLLDSRFGLPQNQQGLSKWVRPHIQNDEGIGRTISTLVNFFKTAEANSKARELAAPPPAAPNEVALILAYEEEDEDGENHFLQAAEGHITKVAIIGKSEGGPITPNQPSNGMSPNRSYIPPERIIARLDVKNLESSLDWSSTVAGPATQEDHSNESPPLSRPKDAETCTDSFTTKESQSTIRSEETRNEKPSTTPQPPAVAFFHLVQSKLTSSELSALKKAIVALHRLGQKQDRKAYLAAALEVVRMLLPHATFENRRLDQKPETLKLLFPLLPEKFRSDVKRKSMIEVLDRSQLGMLCKASLQKDKLQAIRSEVPALLQEVWFRDDDKPALSPAEFLKQAEDILIVFLLADTSKSSEMLASFSRLLPRELLNPTTALISELKARQNIRRMKDFEQSFGVEDAVQSMINPPGTLKKEQMSASQEPSSSIRSIGLHERVANVNSLAASTVIGTGDGSTQIKHFHNPYATKPKAKAPPTSHPILNPRIEPTDERLDSGHLKKRPNPYARNSVFNDSRPGDSTTQTRGKLSRTGPLQALLQKSRGQPVQTSQPNNTINDFLRQSESDTYIGKAGINMANQIVSNAPKSLTCNICEKSTAKVSLLCSDRVP